MSEGEQVQLRAQNTLRIVIRGAGPDGPCDVKVVLLRQLGLQTANLQPKGEALRYSGALGTYVPLHPCRNQACSLPLTNSGLRGLQHHPLKRLRSRGSLTFPDSSVCPL